MTPGLPPVAPISRRALAPRSVVPADPTPNPQRVSLETLQMVTSDDARQTRELRVCR